MEDGKIEIGSARIHNIGGSTWAVDVDGERLTTVEAGTRDGARAQAMPEIRAYMKRAAIDRLGPSRRGAGRRHGPRGPRR